MGNLLTTEILKYGLDNMARKMETCFNELNTLDNIVGDGDLGITMVNGFKAVRDIFPEMPDDDLGSALSKCAQAFTKIRGSSFGTLFATGILAAAKEVKGEKEAAWSKIPGLLTVSIEKMALRGKSKLGDKTLLDGLAAIQASLNGMEDPNEMLETAFLAVNKAIEDFKALPCKQGRARIFADKTIGIDDPGMTVILKLVEGLKESQRKKF